MQSDRIEKLFGSNAAPAKESSGDPPAQPNAQPEAPPAPASPAPDNSGDDLYTKVIAALRTVHDPEIPVNIYDLGLIYECVVDEAEGSVKIKMTLTTPNCPVAGEMPNTTRQAVEKVAGVKRAEVELTWEPRWTQEMMSEDAKLALS